MSASGHVVTWAQCGDGMPVRDPMRALDRVQRALWVCAGGGHAAVAGSKGFLVVSVRPLASISSPRGAWPFWSPWFLSSALEVQAQGAGRGGGASHNFLQRDREAEEAETLVLPSSTAPRRGLLSLLAAGGGERMQSVLSDPQTPGCGGEGTR